MPEGTDYVVRLEIGGGNETCCHVYFWHQKKVFAAKCFPMPAKTISLFGAGNVENSVLWLISVPVVTRCGHLFQGLLITSGGSDVHFNWTRIQTPKVRKNCVVQCFPVAWLVEKRNYMGKSFWAFARQTKKSALSLFIKILVSTRPQNNSSSFNMKH